ncbi:MAG TPA: outer membrane beta-barrel protein [Oligoflexus sp.]|uniref:outer membrane beta-barrel protein n=1 Tax=Oligoflexus sp. TaxID=1971216 RepID=UPI002D2C4343|nr:outer membrane beta-barrel protein [Oligoflexus sp.]HYX31785.1 outer membrane beta-barrel protein [Oligoflexus sp.]
MFNKSLMGMTCACFLGLSAQALAQTTTGTDYKRIDVMRDATNWAFGVNLAAADVNTIDNNVFSFGVFGNYFTAPNFSLGLTLDYWNDSFSETDRRVEVEDLALGANGRFLFSEFTTGLRPFALAGLAVHRFQVDVANRDPNADPLLDKFNEYDRNTEDVEGELGADFGAGVMYRVQTAMDMLAEVRYRRILDRTVDLDQVNYSVALSYVL